MKIELVWFCQLFVIVSFPLSYLMKMLVYMSLVLMAFCIMVVWVSIFLFLFLFRYQYKLHYYSFAFFRIDWLAVRCINSMVTFLFFVVPFNCIFFKKNHCLLLLLLLYIFFRNSDDWFRQGNVCGLLDGAANEIKVQ